LNSYEFYLKNTLPSLFTVLTPAFVSLADVKIHGHLLAFENNMLENDPYVNNHNSKTEYNFLTDLKDNGTYWPLFCIKINNEFILYAGYHRLNAFRRINKDKVFILYREATDLEIKNIKIYETLDELNTTSMLNLRYTIFSAIEIPKSKLIFKKKFYVKSNYLDEYKFLKANGINISEEFCERIPKNYMQFHCYHLENVTKLRNELHDKPEIKPSQLINNPVNEEYWKEIKEKVMNGTYDFSK